MLSFVKYHLGDKYENANQYDADVLLVVALIFLPMECFVEHYKYEKQYADTAWPHAKLVAFNPG